MGKACIVMASADQYFENHWQVFLELYYSTKNTRFNFLLYMYLFLIIIDMNGIDQGRAKDYQIK
jgi:hypothetical protein